MAGFTVHFGSGCRQRLHLDFLNATGNEWILNGPLCEEGMWLYVVVHKVTDENILLERFTFHLDISYY